MHVQGSREQGRGRSWSRRRSVEVEGYDAVVLDGGWGRKEGEGKEGTEEQEKDRKEKEQE